MSRRIEIRTSVDIPKRSLQRDGLRLEYEDGLGISLLPTLIVVGDGAETLTATLDALARAIEKVRAEIPS